MNLIVLTSGELILRKVTVQEPPAALSFDLARLIQAFFTGSAVFTVAGGLLAQFHLLKFGLLAAITAPLIGLSPVILEDYGRSFLNTLRSSEWKFPAKLGLLLVAFELLYLFFVKGFYGIYLLFHNFSLLNLIFLCFVLILSFNLMRYLMKIENVSKYILTTKF